MKDEDADFLNLLRNKALTSVFQPIVDLRFGHIVGYEALVRGPADSPYARPDQLLAKAVKLGKLAQLEFICCALHLQRFKQLGLSGRLFINASAELLTQEVEVDKCAASLLNLLNTYPRGNVIIELSESQPTHDFQELASAAQHYREYGIQIAIDDLGQGFSSLVLWKELLPEYVKIDRYFIHNVHQDLLKQQVVRSICEIAHQAQATVIAEGIETLEELIELRRLGVMGGQGYALGHPLEHPARCTAVSLRSVFEQPFGASLAQVRLSDRPVSVRRLMRNAPTVDYYASTAELEHCFQAQPQAEQVVVLRAGLVVGLLRREQVAKQCQLLQAQACATPCLCGDLIQYTPLVVDRSTSLEDLGHLIATGPEHYLTEGFVITRAGQYVGVGSSVELMREWSQLQVQAAQHANPLTLLPGNHAINQEIARLLETEQPFALCYADIDGFKPFNDVYGYRQGDEAIQTTAKLFQEIIDPQQDFLGHLGGDDFIVIFQSDDWEARCQKMLAQLPKRLAPFYSASHREAGGYWTENRQHMRVFYPLMGLSLGVVDVQRPQLYNAELLAEMASTAKNRAKRSVSNALCIERRAPLASARQAHTQVS